MYTYFKEKLNATQFNCLGFVAPAYIRLPSTINFTINTQTIGIPINATSTNQTLLMPITDNIGNVLRVKVSALITQNGTIYGPLSIAPSK